MNELRYERQIHCIGEEGQKKLSNSSVLVVGAGGLGSTVLYCLAGAGIGKIGIADGDVVSISNLNRQYLYSADDIGKSKAECAKDRLFAFNPDIKYDVYPCFLDETNATEIIKGYDLVVLAVDSINARLIINKACANLKTSIINGGVNGFYGDLTAVKFGKTPCLNCLYQYQKSRPNQKISSLGAVVSAIASLQATAAIRLLLTGNSGLEGKLLCFDGNEMQFDTVMLNRSNDCEICSKIK